MKAAKTTTASVAAPAKKSNTPFFNKEGGQDFFSPVKTEQPFFSNNKSATPFIQAKLTVGKPNDPYEQEADSVADKVVQRLSEPGADHQQTTGTTAGDKPASVQAKPIASTITPMVQAKCAECEQKEKLQKKEDKEQEEVQRKPVFESNEEKPVQRKSEPSATSNGTPAIQLCAACDGEASEEQEEKVQPKEEEPLQRKCAACEEKEQLQQKSAGQGDSPAASVEAPLHASKGSGSSLPDPVRGNMESAFGADFSQVKVHTGSSASQMNKNLNAQAFTHGSDIYFNSNKYNPDSKPGQQLLAHELTHTIQQGHSSSTVNRVPAPAEEEETVVQREVDCNAPAPAASTPAAADERSTTPLASRPTCAVTNPPAEEPPEGTEEPSEEERPADVEATAGAPVDERQSHAPPADENAPPREEGVEEGAEEAAAPQDPCALREAGGATGEAPATGATGGAPPAPPAGDAGTGGGGGEGAPVAGGAEGSPEGTTETAGATGGGGGEGAREESGTGFLQTITAQGISPNIVPEGLGEAASPELQTQRNDLVLSEEVAFTSLEERSNAIRDLTSMSITFLPEPKDEEQSQKNTEEARRNQAQSGLMANTFLQDSGRQLEDFIDRGRKAAEDCMAKRVETRLLLEADIQNRRNETSAAFAGMRAAATAKATIARQAIDARYAQTIAQIEVKAILSTVALMLSKINAQTQLDTAKTTQLTALDGVYTTAYNELIAVGQAVGRDAEGRAARHSRAYRNADGTEDPDIQNKVRNQKKDGFWDGYLTYNRYIARADSATEVGNQYKQGMEQEGQKQADNMMCGKPVDIEVVNTIHTESSETLQCTHDNAADTIQRQRQVAIMQAQYTQQQLNNAVQTSLQATLTQLREREAGQLQLINDYGIRQVMSIERDTAQSLGSMLNGVNEAAGQVLDSMTSFRNEVQSMQAPAPAQFEEQVRGMQGQVSGALSAATAALDISRTGTETIIATGTAQSQMAIGQLSADGISGGYELSHAFSASMESMITNAQSSYDQLWTNIDQAITGATTNGTTQINAVATGVTGLYTQMNANLTTRFAEGARHLRTGMTDSLNEDFDAKICAEAEKAAADVQPWWKTVLKVLLVIIVIVVVALVIGPAVIGAVGAMAASMAGALGAGAALAGTIGTWVGAIVGGAIVGALSGAVIQVGNNLIDAIGNGPLTWERVGRGVGRAIIAGAIGGALGGLGGQLGQLLVGRLATAGVSAGRQFLAEFGVNMAFDVIGGVLGDLAAGNPITWQSVAMGVAIGGAVQISMSGLSGLARRSMAVRGAGGEVPTGGRFNAFANRVAGSRLGRGAERVTDFQGSMMGAGERFGARVAGRVTGGRAPTVDATRAALADARARLEEGQFRPPKDTADPEGWRPPVAPETESPTPRSTSDSTDINEPRVQQELDELGPMTAETRQLLAENPGLRRALLENPVAARALKKCNSPCFPTNMHPDDVGRLGSLLEAHPDINPGRLSDYLYHNRDTPDGLTKAVDQLVNAENPRAFIDSVDIPRRVTSAELDSAAAGRLEAQGMPRSTFDELSALGYPSEMLEGAMKNFRGVRGDEGDVEFGAFVSFLRDVGVGPKPRSLTRALEDLHAGGPAAAEASDFISRVANMHQMESLRPLDIDGLRARFEAGDALLCQGHLQPGEFPAKPHEVLAGYILQTPSGDNPAKQLSGRRSVDFVIIDRGNGLELIIGYEHSGLSGGRTSVYGAGEMRITKNGLIEGLTPISGHYRPTRTNLERARQWLIDNGHLDPNIPVPIL